MAKSLPEAFEQQPLSRNRRVIRKKEPMHPAMKQAKAIFDRMHGGKRSSNQRRNG